MCRPDQSARTAQADLVDILRRCLSPQLHFEKMCRHVPTLPKGSYAPECVLQMIKPELSYTCKDYFKWIYTRNITIYVSRKGVICLIYVPYVK